jgi:hypothetical protein
MVCQLGIPFIFRELYPYFSYFPKMPASRSGTAASRASPYLSRGTRSLTANQELEHQAYHAIVSNDKASIERISTDLSAVSKKIDELYVEKVNGHIDKISEQIAKACEREPMDMQALTFLQGQQDKLFAERKELFAERKELFAVQDKLYGKLEKANAQQRDMMRIAAQLPEGDVEMCPKKRMQDGDRTLCEELLGGVEPLTEELLRSYAHPSMGSSFADMLNEKVVLPPFVCSTLSAAREWCHVDCHGTGEAMIYDYMKPIHDLMVNVCRAHVGEERVKTNKVRVGADVTDSRIITDGQKGCSGYRSDYVIFAGSFVIMCIEYKDAKSKPNNHKTQMERAKEQLQRKLYWLPSLFNKAPFHFAIAATQHGGEIYAVAPLDRKGEVTLVPVVEFDLSELDGREKFLNQVLNILRFALVQLVPQAAISSCCNVEDLFTEGDDKEKYFAIHRSSIAESVVKIYPEKVEKKVALDRCTPANVLSKFYKAFNAAIANRPASLPTRIKYTAVKGEQTVSVTLAPVAYRPVYPLSDKESICVVRDVLDALLFIHGLYFMHRDVRQANILQKEVVQDAPPAFMLVDFEQVDKLFAKLRI